MSKQIIPQGLMPNFKLWIKTDPIPIDGLSYCETFMKLWNEE